MPNLPALIAQELARDLPPLTPETSWRDLHASDLEVMLVIMAVEEAHGLAFTDAEIASVATVGDLERLVRGKVGQCAT